MKYINKWMGGALIAASLMLASCASDNNDLIPGGEENIGGKVETVLTDSVCDALGKSAVEEFLDFAKNPRCTFYSIKSSAYLVEWAKKHNLEYGIDDSLNVWMDVPANTEAMKSYPKVILQGHQDMVCGSEPGMTYDYTQVVGEPYYDGNKLKGRKVNLGADDGIGVGMALAIAASNVAHGPLRLIFTTNEEDGEPGVEALPPSVLDADYLLSFDDEDYAKLTTGCLGGYICDLEKSYTVSQAAAGSKEISLEVIGLRGGHSGSTIGEKRLSGVTILAKVLKDVVTPNEGKLVAINCGAFSNAIANDLKMQFIVDSDKADACKTSIEQILANYKTEYTEEPFTSTCTATDVPTTDAANACPEQILTDLNQYFAKNTQGVIEREGTDGLVTKSNNIGVVTLANGDVVLTTFARAYDDKWVESEKAFFISLASELGMSLSNEVIMPAWDTPDNDPFLNFVYGIYKGVDPKAYKHKTEGGLECAYFVKMKPSIKTVAMGPDIRGNHTIDEYVDTTTLKPMMQVIMNILQKIGTLSK